MHNLNLLSLGLVAMASLAIATESSPVLFSRQLVTIPCSEQGDKDCGSGCIDASWTCCPQQAGGCPPTAYCSVGEDGEEGCCPNGEVCGGPGGVITNPGGTITSSSTNTFTSVSTKTLESTLTSTSIDSSTETSTSTSTPRPTLIPTSTSTTTTYSVEVPPTTTSSSNATVTTPSVQFTGGTEGGLGTTPAFPILGALFAAFFML